MIVKCSTMPRCDGVEAALAFSSSRVTSARRVNVLKGEVRPERSFAHSFFLLASVVHSMANKGAAAKSIGSANVPSSTNVTAQAAAGAGAAGENLTRGPPLGSSSHTVQLLILLSLNSLLIFLCLFVLPVHLLWRQAVKQHTLLASDSDALTAGKPVSQLAQDAVNVSSERADSALRNLVGAYRLFFSAPNSDLAAVSWIRRGARSTLAAVVLTQGWFVARFKGWWDEAEAMERGDREEVLKRRRIGMAKQMEIVTLTTFALPLVTIVVYLIVVLCGAPFVKNPVDTLLLAAYIAVLAVLPAMHLMGTDEREWIKAFSLSPSIRQATLHAPRFRVLARSATCTLAGALFGAAGNLLDWDKAWQTYPVPPILGACIGLLVGNFVGALTYFFSAPSRAAGPRVERKKLNKSKQKKKR